MRAARVVVDRPAYAPALSRPNPIREKRLTKEAIMALNFTEKQLWKNRIEAKIGQRIAKLRADNAALIDELNDQAKDEVTQALGLDGDFETLNRLDDELVALEERKEELLLSMQEKISGEDPSGDNWNFRRLHRELAARQEQRADELLSAHMLGRQIGALQTEKENLCDAVLLAGGINQIVDIWDRVTNLITGEVTAVIQEELFSQNDSENPAMTADDELDGE